MGFPWFVMPWFVPQEESQEMCLSFSVTALSWAGFLKGFIPPSMTQDIQFAHAETAISRKDCQENPLIFSSSFGNFVEAF